MKNVLLFLFLLLNSCDSSESNSEYPKCIEEKIDLIKKEEERNPPAKIFEWTIDSNTYYYITSDCCDQYNYLYDSDCNLICAPDGGITGMGDGNCPNFIGEIKKILIWEDSRK